MEQSDLDFWTTEAMIQYGGSFVRALGHLYRKGDRINKAALKTTFPKYWKQYGSDDMIKRVKD